MKSFHEMLRLVETFSHPASVPKTVAFAVYRIMHNQATADDWESLDFMITQEGLEQVLEWVGDTLKANPHPDMKPIETELQWFKKELTRSGGLEN